jgi:tRNA1Val (adenine37-N6)-methyltransferase
MEAVAWNPEFSPPQSGETLDSILRGRVRLFQPANGYRFSLDPLFLADFVVSNAEDRVLDLGGGCGVIPLVLFCTKPFRYAVGVEIQERLYQLACRNAQINDACSRVRFIHGDLRTAPGLLMDEQFEVVISNPPYRKVGEGRLNPDPEKALARHEVECSLNDLAGAFRATMQPGGRVYLIHQAERRKEVVDALSRQGLYPYRLRWILAREDGTPIRFLMEARADSVHTIEEMSPLIVHTPLGEFTPEVQRIVS